EYYGDAILFGGCAVPLAEVVERDLDYYARAGVRGVSCLVFGQYSLWAYGVNVEAFARGAVFPPAAAGARGAHAARFGRPAEPMVRYLAALERWLPAAGPEARDAALAALAGAVRHVRAADPALTGTWGRHDLEITHHFFAGALDRPETLSRVETEASV